MMGERIHHSRTSAAVRQQYAPLLMARLAAAHPKFDRLTQVCAMECRPGIDEAPEWQIWTGRPTTPDQLMIEEQLDHLVSPTSSLLHIGAGNSSLGRRFAPRVASIVGTTIHAEEKEFADDLHLENYNVLVANKFDRDMDRIQGRFDFIIDNNPSSFACCLFHFATMLVSYVELLECNGGRFLSARPGLRWVCPGNDPNWALDWDDWERIGDVLRMPVARMTKSVFSMQRLHGHSLAVLDPAKTLRTTSSAVPHR